MEVMTHSAKRDAYQIAVATKLRDLYPYTNSKDSGHAPGLTAVLHDNNVVLCCRDLFKLKKNKQVSPKTRADIYLPPAAAALQLADDIRQLVGDGELGQLVLTNPRAVQAGPRALPGMDETRVVRHLRFALKVAGYIIPAGPGSTYITLEWPDKTHTMMSHVSLHLGVKFDKMDNVVKGERDDRLIWSTGRQEVTKGVMYLTFTKEHARNLGTTLRYIANQQRRASNTDAQD